MQRSALLRGSDRAARRSSARASARPKGKKPESSVKSVTPDDHASTGGARYEPSPISGALYDLVPTLSLSITCSRVSWWRRVVAVAVEEVGGGGGGGAEVW